MSRAESVQCHIVEKIRTHNLQPGDRLPTVRQLAMDCHVTTPTVREALRALETAGVVELRHGSGTYVHPNAFRLVVANPVAIPTTQQRQDLLKARLILEPAIAAEAAKNRTCDDIQKLHECAQRALFDHLPPNHVSFHVLVAQATGNPVIADVVNGLLADHIHIHRTCRQSITDRHTDHDQHQEIITAIDNKDPHAAEVTMRDHLKWLLGTHDTNHEAHQGRDQVRKGLKDLCGETAQR